MVNPGDNETAESDANATLDKPTSSAAAGGEADEVEPDDQGRAPLLNQGGAAGDNRPGDIELADIARVPDVQVAGGGANGDLEAGDAAKIKDSLTLADGDATKAKKKLATAGSAERGLEFAGLTKEELEHFAKDPFWRRLRLILFVLFWVVWLAMFAAVIIIIVLSPKCPPRQAMQFWQRPFYRLEVRSFAPDPSAPSVPSRAGSLAGLSSRVDYVRYLGINNFLLDSLVLRQTVSGCPLDFTAIDPSLGSLDQLRTLTKRGRKKGFQLMMELDVSQADPAWKLPEAGVENPFVKDSSNFDRMLSRDGKKAWSGDRLSTPRSTCASLNTSSEKVRRALLDSMSFWLDVGLSGFSLTNAAFMVPKKTNLGRNNTPPASPAPSGWYRTDPLPWLNSPEAAEFVRSVRAFLDAEAVRRGRELALFVDLGDVAYPMPFANISAAFGAHAVVHTGLGEPLLPATAAKPGDAGGLRASVEAALTAANALGTGSFAWASNWPYLRRDGSPALAVLGLTLPGLGLIYYGQELGMSHVSDYRLSANFTGYLTGSDSTDQARSPMQWTGSQANAGWLADPSESLAWAGSLSVRAADILANNLRKLNSSGYSDSNLNLVRKLVAMATNLESLQWGRADLLPNLPADPQLVGFTRKAVRFPGVLVLINAGDQMYTVDPSASAGGSSGVLKLLYSWGSGGGSHTYAVGSQYKFEHLYVPARTALIFVVD